jgi:hypothetical protein
MADNKDRRDGRDRSRVDANDPNEVEHIHSQFPNLTHQQIKKAIETHGPMRDDILRFLRIQDPGSMW